MRQYGNGAATLLPRRRSLLATAAASRAMVWLPDAAVVQKKPVSAYQANGTVRVTIVVGNATYLGGQFTAMVPNGGGTAVTRNHVAAVSTATGAPAPVEPERERHRVRDDREQRHTSTSAARSPR